MGRRKAFAARPSLAKRSTSPATAPLIGSHSGQVSITVSHDLIITNTSAKLLVLLAGVGIATIHTYVHDSLAVLSQDARHTQSLPISRTGCSTNPTMQTIDSNLTVNRLHALSGLGACSGLSDSGWSILQQTSMVPHAIETGNLTARPYFTCGM